MQEKTNKIVIAVIIAVGICVSAFLIGYFFYKTKSPVKTVSVVGLAEKEFVSDLIVLDFSFKTKNMDMKLAFNELKEQREVVKNYLKEKGIAEKDIKFNAIDHTEDYDYQYDEIHKRSISVFRGYVFTQSVRIESKEVQKVEELYQNMVDLLDQGVAVDAYSPSYYYTKLADLKMEMLASATEDAHHRAEIIATNAGAKLANLKVANAGVFQITAPNSADEDYTWGGVFNTSSKEKKASVNMRLTYYVK